MLIDLITIYLIFCSPHDCDYQKKNKKNKNKTSKKIVLKNNSEEPIKEKILINNDNIDIYNDNKSISLNTY